MVFIKLGFLLTGISNTLLCGSYDAEIEYIETNSQKCKDGSLFLCLKGERFDGHDFITDAVKNGSKAILVDKDIDIPQDKSITIVKVADTREILSKLVNRTWGYPLFMAKKIAVTGTNGKTTIAYMVAHILNFNGIKTGFIGTLQNNVAGVPVVSEQSTPTTPDSIELARIMNEMDHMGARALSIEVSSSALKQGRVSDIWFDTAIFTNLTRDHLDEHKSMENYKSSKKLLFGKCDNAVINIDCPVGREIINEFGFKKFITYSLNNNSADVYVTNISADESTSRFTVNYKGKAFKAHINIPGSFNISNAMAAIAACELAGVNVQNAIDALKELKSVPGRFESISIPNGGRVVIDYAHTPDAIVNLLEDARKLCTGRIIAVFGSAGGRDHGKRPQMGDAAYRLSDYIILTSDDPRFEDPEQICKEIAEGFPDSPQKPWEVFIDRKTAIERAMEIAQPDDLVILAGKGADFYQMVGDQKMYFNEKHIIEEYIIKKNGER